MFYATTHVLGRGCPRKGWSRRGNDCKADALFRQRKQKSRYIVWDIDLDYPGLQHALSACGEKVLLKAPVDGFHEATNTVLQFHECYFHGCPKCYQDRAAKNAINEETFDVLYTKTTQRTQQLRNAGYRVVEKWSCKFSDEDRWQANEFGLESKVSQLVPKDAFYGGCTEAINLQTALTEEDIQNGKEILYYDVTSEYPCAERISKGSSNNFSETSSASNK